MALSLRTSIEQAAMTRLRDYLQAELTSVYGGGDREKCVVSDTWPAADSGLPFRAVTVLAAGDREDTNVQEQDIRKEAFDGHLKLYTWRVACCRQPVQLDVWSKAGAHRDDLVARLGDILRRGERYTCSVPNGNPVRDGVLLELDPNKSGYRGFVDCTFEGPRRMDS